LKDLSELELANGGYGLEVGDIDGDGDLDVLVANYQSAYFVENIATYMNEGGGELYKVTVEPQSVTGSAGWHEFRRVAEPFFVDIYSGYVDVSMADINGDGDLDVLIANDNGRNAMYLNDGVGGFQKVVEGTFVTGGGFLGALEVVDIDGDDDLDVLGLATSWHEGNNSMYINEGGGALQQITQGVFVTDRYTGDMEVVDLDGDSDLDVLIATCCSVNIIYINDGGHELRKLMEGAFVTDPGYDSYGLEVVDIDGDGDVDVLVANYGENNAMYVNEGGGELRKVTGDDYSDFATDDAPSRDLEVADIDGDGDFDVFIANDENENNAMYVQRGCPAGSARLSSGASWCFDCPAFTVHEGRGGYGEPRALKPTSVFCQNNPNYQNYTPDQIALGEQIAALCAPPGGLASTIGSASSV
jgi:hypothetical protein